MTQLSEGAVGGASDTVVAAEPTLTDRFAAIADVQADDPNKKKPEEDVSDEAIAAEAEQSLTPEDVIDEEAPAAEGDEQPIPPPVSWTAEEKADFAELPRKQQEIISRREADREKFVQAKAQEAKATRAQVEREAVTFTQQLQETHANALQALMVPVPQRPSYTLQNEDPYAFAEQMDAHERATSWNAHVGQQVAAARAQAQQQANLLQQHESGRTMAILSETFPEYLDATKGPELRNKLGSTALELGYSADQLANVDANDILAMRTATEWRDKAAKYDRLMAKKMETVREAKNLPRVSRPGTAQGRGAAEGQRYAADRQAMNAGDKDAARRVFSKFI